MLQNKLKWGTRKKGWRPFCLYFLLIICTCCTRKPKPVHLINPPGFVKMAIPEDNPLTEEGIALGRMLFYDPILSADSSLSCATCHIIQLGFTDGKTLAEGIDGNQSRRSAPSLANIGYYYKGLFWDGRVATLEEQALLPVEDSVELGHSWERVEQLLQEHPIYPKHFEAAFGIKNKKEIDRYLAAKAIAQFERSLISKDSKFDRVQRGEEQFTASEKRGWTIYFDASDELPKSECGHCHLDPLFTNLDFFNNGIEQVDSLEAFPDKGRGAVTGWVYNNGQFRTPTLRNIELTAPYMHDGRMETLEEVLEHYISGGHFTENVNPNVRRLHFSERDKKDLIAFLKTLTDTLFIQNPDFASPFNSD